MIVHCPDCKRPLIEFDQGSGNYHCSNPSCNFQYIELMSGKEHRKGRQNDEMKNIPSVSSLDKKPKRILVGLAIENSLLNMGHTIFDRVTSKLRDEYNANVFDCLDNPEFLKQVMAKNFDKKVQEVMYKSIRTVLGEFAYYDSIRQFLDELNRGN